MKLQLNQLSLSQFDGVDLDQLPTTSFYYLFITYY